MSTTNPQRIAALLDQFRACEAVGRSAPSAQQRTQRGEILDELQDLVGLGGKMVTENDILKRANQLAGK